MLSLAYYLSHFSKMAGPQVLSRALINIHTYEGMINQEVIHAGRSPFKPTTVCHLEAAYYP